MVAANDDCPKGHGDGDAEAQDIEIRQIMAMYDVADRHAARVRHDEIMSIVDSSGNDSRKYR